MRSWNRLLA